jgi:phosphatidylglycerol:prolipoprotein diacylglycerol transferase
MGLFNVRTNAWEYYHPTFLYESLWNAIGFVILALLCSKRKYDGQVALGYAAWYGLGRALIEGLRMDSLYIGPFRVSQLLAAISCFAAVGILVFQSFRSHDPKALYANRAEDPAVTPEAEDLAVTPEAEQTADVENTQE